MPPKPLIFALSVTICPCKQQRGRHGVGCLPIDVLPCFQVRLLRPLLTATLAAQDAAPFKPPPNASIQMMFSSLIMMETSTDACTYFVFLSKRWLELCPEKKTLQVFASRALLSGRCTPSLFHPKWVPASPRGKIERFFFVY